MIHTIESNAIKIAELLETASPELYKKFSDYSLTHVIGEKEHWEKYFSSYNGLMPIVFECNMGPAKYGFIDIQFKRKYVQYLCDENPAYFEFLEFDDEYKFMEALQLCCIKYLEVK